MTRPSPAELRTLVADLDDTPGTLNRVASLFRRRCYNIVSLNVGRTHRPGVSRMTVVVEADDQKIRQIVANLEKLVCVLSIEDVTHEMSIIRDLALIKVEVAEDRRLEVIQICEIFRGRVVDVAKDSMVLEVTGTPEKIQGCLSVLEPFGIEEMVQCGAVAIARGEDRRKKATGKAA